MTRVTNFNIHSAKVFVITTADAVVKYYNIRSIYNTNEKCEHINVKSELNENLNGVNPIS